MLIVLECRNIGKQRNIEKNLLDEMRSGKVTTLYNVKCRSVPLKGTLTINLIK